VAPPADQLAALDFLAADTGLGMTLFGADRTRLASVGAPLGFPERRGVAHAFGGPPSWAIDLPDGRWLVVRPPHHPGRPAGFLFLLALAVLAVGAGAYPVVRRLTSRLERLHAGVESLGAGDLSARVRVEGRDEVARLAESFNRAAARIEDLVRAHKTLLANASHELRTPLARIRMAVELLKENADERRTRELEADIAELDALIEEILVSSRLDAGGGFEPDEDVDLLALATEESARYDGVTVDGAPVTVRGSARLLRRAIRNLLENARRHGAPPVSVSVTRTPDRVEIAVCDHGPGIPDAERERVFEPFHRGLGLSLVRQIARRHGGDARCAGSCFVVALPGASLADTPA
jgi:signal transduction histidine kinase